MTKVSIPKNPSSQVAWRMRACQLAFEHKMVGSAGYTDEADVYFCPSAIADNVVHRVDYNPEWGTVMCDCAAGSFLNPCSHAGAVIWLIVGCAPPRVRDAQGFTHE